MATDTQTRTEMQHRAWQSALSLIRTLGSSLDVAQVTKLSLLTVTGQLLVSKAAFFLREGEQREFRLCSCLGVRSEKLGTPTLRLPEALDRELLGRQPGWVTALDPRCGLDPTVLAHFQNATYLSDGNQTVGLLLLGGKINGRGFDRTDQSLLSTMGLVVGTTLQKAMAYEDVVRVNARLEEAEQLRQQIVDHVSHEFNTPLLVVKSTAEMVRDADEDTRDELFSMLDEAVERLERLVNAVLSVASHGPGGEPSLQEMSHEELLGLVVEPGARKWQDKGVRVMSGHRPDRLLRVDLDVHMVARILDALVDNAWCFRRPENNWVVVNSYMASRPWWKSQDHLARLASLREALAEDVGEQLPEGLLPDTSSMVAGGFQLDEPALVIEVLDGGVGIPEGEHRAIFEAFRQASNSPNLGVRGAGMGLSSARKDARAMGGDLVLASQEGHGSVFALLLPARFA